MMKVLYMRCRAASAVVGGLGSVGFVARGGLCAASATGIVNFERFRSSCARHLPPWQLWLK
jgi:hypothetical protein